MRGVARIIIATLTLIIIGATPAQALETIPGTPPLVEGPLQITKYSFQGSHVRFVEIYNSSDEVASLDGWRLVVLKAGYQAKPETIVALSGMLAPDSWVTAGDKLIFTPTRQLSFPYANTTDMMQDPLARITLQPPDDIYLSHIVTPSISGSTPRLATDPATFGFQRNISSSTGNYSATAFTAVMPDEPTFIPFDDGLYVPPEKTFLNIVEVYPNSSTCSPHETFSSSPLCFDYLKVHNPTSQEIDLEEIRVHSGSNTHALSGMLPASSFAIFPLTLNNSGWAWIEDRYGTTIFKSSLVEYPDAGSHRGQAWSFDGTEWRWTQYPTPYDTPNQFTDGSPINTCSTVRINEVGANVRQQFIEVYNASNTTIELGGCQLRTNRSNDAKYVFDAQRLMAGGLVSVEIARTDLVLTKTTSGTVYVLSSDGLTEVDARSYENLSENSSLALIDGVWRQTFTVTPGSTNGLTEYPPCQEGYWRNTETGRCNKLVVANQLLADCGVGRERNLDTGRCRAVTGVNVLTPCRPGQVRNPQTNRCRSTASIASVLSPCRPGQERNPATNRCRSIVSAASTLKPCAPGQERNPATNRCRKIATLAATDVADFPVEPIADSGKTFAAWWALGGVLLFGAGYATWEWRHEISRIVRSVMTRSKIE